MSKAVMLSIQPKWCELIANGKKTIEVRKTRPSIETPFKCYIYATKPKTYSHPARIYNSFIMPKSGECGSGKVIGEFVCNGVEAIVCHKRSNGVGFDYTYYTELKDTLVEETQLTDYDIRQYLGCAEDGECIGYAWHISDLVIYDTPRELGEFKKQNSCYKPGNIEKLGCWEKSCPVQELGECDGQYSVVTRPPQSWCYVEV